VDGLDIARFLAFVGMVLVNFRIAAEVAPAADWPSTITNALEGRAAALFVMLAGVGFALGSAKWHLTVRRALFLFVIGMVNMLIFEADILHFYALFFLVAMIFSGATPRVLLIGAGALILAGVIGLIALDYERGWNWNTLTYADFWTLRGFLRNTFYNGWHPVVPWAAFVLIGMWIGRLELTSRAVQWRLLIYGVAGAVGFAVISRLLSLDTELAEIAGLSPIPPGPVYMLAASASSIAVLGVVLLVAPLLQAVGVAKILAMPGRQTLTLYVAHILLGMGTLQAMGRLDGSYSTAQIFWISIGFCAAVALYSVVWSRIYRRGPLEALMRLLTEAKT